VGKWRHVTHVIAGWSTGCRAPDRCLDAFGDGGDESPTASRSSLAEQPTQHDDRVGQTGPKLHDPPGAFGAPAQLAELVAPGEGALHRPPVGGLDRGRGALVGELALEVALGQGGAGGVAVVGGVQGHRDVGGQRSQRGQGGQGCIQGRSQQRGVMAVGGRWHRGQRDAPGLGGQRALQALCAAVDRAATSELAAAGRLGATPIDGHVVQRQPDHAVGGRKDQQVQPLAQAERDPRIPAATKRRGRAAGVLDAAVAAAKHQDPDELVEDHSLGDAPSVTAQWVGVVAWGNRAANWSHRGSRMHDGSTGTGDLVGCGGTCPRIQASRCLRKNSGSRSPAPPAQALRRLCKPCSIWSRLRRRLPGR
jgi:hypothetical protein